MKSIIRHIAFLMILFIGVLGSVFASNLVHDASKISIEKSAVGCERFKAWEKLSSLTGTREWTRRSISLLEKMSGKSDDFIDKVRQYYSTHTKLPLS